MNKIPFLSICAILLVSCSPQEDKIIDVYSILNKRPVEVEEILGKPDSSYNLPVLNKLIFTQLYKKHGIEIKYPKSLASDIYIKNPLPHNYGKGTLKALGLEVTTPTDSFPNGYYKWRNYEGIKIVNMYVTHLTEEGEADRFEIFIKAKDPVK